MVRSAIALAGLIYAVSAAGVLFNDRAKPELQNQPAAQSTPAPTEPLRGFSINLHHTDQFSRYLTAVDHLAELGFNSLQVLTPVFQTDGSADHVQILTGPSRGPTRAQLVQLLTYAHRRGMRTSLMPVVLFTDPRGNEWRGKIHPEFWDPWWQSYQKAIDYFADVAAEANVQIFCVGSELISTEREPHRWAALIKNVRARFKGQLTYSTTWDHYHVPTIWRHVDLIGISAYWDIASLTDPASPDPLLLAERWTQIRQRILDFADAHGRPVLFTEVGYPALPWALNEPWNYINTTKSNPDLAKQALGYAAFLAAWGDLLLAGITPAPAPKLAGVFFYEWDPYRSGGQGDTGYGIKGKPAEILLRDWLTSLR